jgi:predicted NACHT family NTPase
LIEGSPGCGKTTLLKILALKILAGGGKVFYLPCSIVSKEFKNASLRTILKNFAQGSAPKSGSTKASVLILDGLDEASFDFSSRILSNAEDFQNVVVSSRNSFHTSIRGKSFRVSLSPFSDHERNLFFEKWFKNSTDLIAQAKHLIKTYPDIEIHTRLPLIATITVALLQNGMVPRTRAEIYSFRLELLLSKWDRFRGVDRLYVDNPDAKRRFLRHLAFQIHSSANRRRQVSLNEIKEIYENSLGTWGYKIDRNQLLNDLIVGSGVLFEEGESTYSLGHLTFQEHLVAEYLVETFSTEKISRLLGNDWWREPLNFYASIKGDITALIDYSINSLDYLAHVRQLADMALYAPYTGPGALHIVSESAQGVWLDESFENDVSNEDETID